LVIYNYSKHISPETVSTSVKDKAFPLKAWGGLEGSRRLRLPDFKTIDT
jgi:hypothetical protein